MNKVNKYKAMLITVFVVIVIMMMGIVWGIFFRKVDYYEYPLSQDSPKWSVMSPISRVEELIIPNKVLKRMTDKALIQAIADYPLLIDLYVSGTVQDGIVYFSNECSALRELLSRESAKTSLLTDGVDIMNDIYKNDQDHIAVYALYDIITTLYKDVDTESLFPNKEL